MRVSDLEVPEDQEAVLAWLERLVRVGFDHFESRHRRKDGTTWPVHITASFWGETQCFVVFVQDISDRLNAQEEIRQNAARLQAIGDNLPNGAVYRYQVDADGRRSFPFMSRGFESVIGIRAEDAMADADVVLNTVHPDDKKLVEEAAAESLAKGSPFFCEIRLGQRDGIWRWATFRSAPTRMADGSMFWDGVMIDVTEAHQAHEALRQSEEQLRLALAAAGAATWAWQGPEDQLLWSPENYSLHGIDPKVPIRYSTLEAIMLPEDRHKTNQALQEMKEGRTDNIRAEYRIHHPERGLRWLVGLGQMVRRADGLVERVSGISLDITDLRTTELALAESNTRLCLALQAADAVPFVWDIPTDRITRFDLPNTSVLGIKESMGSFRERIHPDDQEAFQVTQSKCFAKGTAYRNRYRLLQPDASYRWMESWGHLERASDGSPCRLLGVRMDVTAREQTREAIQGQNRILEQISTGAGLDLALTETIRLVESQMPGILGSILLVDEKAKRLRRGAAPNLPEEYNHAVDGVPIGIGFGSCGTAAQLGKAVIVTDIATDPLWKDYRELALAHGLRSCASFPILASGKIADYPAGKVLGTFALYRREAGLPDPLFQGILEEPDNGTESGEDDKFDRLLAPATHLARVAIERDLTERILRNREEQLRLALESANQGLYDLNVQTGECTTSPEYATILGYDPAEFHETNAAWIERLHPDDRERCIVNFRDYLAGQLPCYRIEFRLRTREDRWKWILSVGKVVERDGVGAPLRMLGTHTDISVLKEAEERWRLLAEHVPAALALFDTQMCYVSYSHRWATDFGVDDQDLTGRSHYEVFPDLPERWREVHQRALAGEVVRSEEDRFVRADGKVCLLRWEVRPWFQTGKTAGIVIFSEDITERAESRAALGESESGRKLILNAVGDAVFGLDDRMRIQFVNPAAISMFGYAEEDLLGREMHDLLHKRPGEENPQSPEECPVIQTFQSNEIRTGTVRLWRKDGKELAVEFTSSAYLDFANERHVVVTFRDVSERLAAQQALRASEEQLRILVDSVPIGLLVVDMEGRILRANARIGVCFGYTADELIGKSVDLLVPNRLREKHIDHRRQFTAIPTNRQLIGRDLFGLRKDGTEFPVELGLAISMSGACPVVLAAVSDISERKQAEQALRQSEFRYRTVIDQGLDPLYIMDVDARFLDVNDAACLALGYSRDELLARGVLDIDSAIQPDTLMRMNQKLAMTPGQTVGLVTRHRRKDTTEFPVEVRCSAVELNGTIRLVAIARDVSERLRAEKELQESHRFLRSVLDSLSAHIAVLDEEGNIITTNEAWNRFGLENGGGVEAGSNYLSCCFDESKEVRSEEAAKVAEGIRAVIAHQRREFYHDYPCHSPTEKRWFSMRVTPFPGEGPMRVVVAHENITHRKLAEQLLARMNQELEQRVQERTSELARLAAILDASPDFIAICNDSDPTRRLIYCNAAMGRQAQRRGLDPLDLTADKFHTASSLRRVLEEGMPTALRDGNWVGETEVFDADGTIIPVSQLLLHHKTPDGLLSHTSTVMRDLTVHKKLAADLRESEERFRLIASTIQDVFWMSTLGSTRMLYVSPGYEQLWGKSCQSLYDDPKSFSDAIHPDDRATVLETITNHQGGSYDAEYRLLRGDGAIRWVRVRGYPVGKTNGEPVLMVGTATDVTERHLAEDALRERSEELALANAELAKASRMKDEFLASMSHELRTPLNGVLAISEALQENVYGGINEKQASALRDIEQSGRHLLTLINDILDLSKVEAGRIVLEPALTDVEGLCQAAQRIVKETAHKKRLHVSTRVDCSLGSVLADERRLKQILVNLLSNAVKFTPDGGSIGLEVEGDAEHQLIRFTVWDTGIGIRAEDMCLLFRPFQQIDSSLARQYSGTGLGLALVRRLAELHDGGVAVESESEKGSRFTVTIPWVRPKASEPYAAPEAASPELWIRKILIVEDSPCDSSQIKRSLQEMGIEAYVHPGAHGAVERIRADRPDLVLLDMMLPDGEGWELLLSLKADAVLKKIPVIVISNFDDGEKLIESGAFEHLVKPIDRDMLVGAIGRLSSATSMLYSNTLDLPRPGSDRILLAEDNPVNARVVRDAFQAVGYHVDWAVDGRQAVELASKQNPHLILMDIQMPGMDGFEAIRRIRTERSMANVPIVALTALAMPGDRERCLAAGANEYLAKPVSLKVLLRMVSRLLMAPTRR